MLAIGPTVNATADTGALYDDRDDDRVFALAFEGVLHDLGNSLNRIALEAAVLQAKIGEPHRAAIDAIRAEVRAAAAAVRPLQQVGRPASSLELQDLAIVHPALAGCRCQSRGRAADFTLLTRLLTLCAGEWSGAQVQPLADERSAGLVIVGTTQSADDSPDDCLGPVRSRALSVLAKRTGAQSGWSVESGRWSFDVRWPTLTYADGRTAKDARGDHPRG